MYIYIINEWFSQYIDPLPSIDHSTIEYSEFIKNFYVEHEDIASLDENKVVDLRSTLGIRVSGANPPKPVTSFGHFGYNFCISWMFL